MPPRKSNVSQASPTDDGGTPVKEREGTNIEDLSLPRTMVQRLAKGVLPPNTSLHKDAILALSKGATVFINYLAQAANEANATTTSRKNIPPGAVLEALHDLEFEDFIPRVEAELRKYNETQTGKRNEYRKKVKEGKMGGGGKGEDGDEGAEGEGEGGGRAAKRVRRGSVEKGEGDGGDESGLLGQQLGVGVVGDGDGEGDGYRQRIRVEEGGDEDFEGEEEGAEEDGGEEDAGEGYDLRERKEEESEEEEEEDDEDTYPDEGRRLSSIEAEAEALEMGGREVGSGEEEEEGSGSGSGSGEESY
ncbi:hypothetical protein JMJ35_008156 [Cladonia borealis]|uniref:DNA polymerase epsilon subunit D n=1 Tax=Cladonia borealis TaxID=184061 RepID=A0AA39QV17_9LECA|nr:hypothetical protein JMJ35_008156 [Cladonia borealis]